MKASIITPGWTAIDHSYERPVAYALSNKFCDFIQDLDIEEALTSAEPGPDTIWCWSAQTCGIKLTLVMPCVDWGESFSKSDRYFFGGIADNISMNDRIILGTYGWTQAKLNATLKYKISRSDIVFAVWNNMSGIAAPPGFQIAKDYDKEIIIINPKELITL